MILERALTLTSDASSIGLHFMKHFWPEFFLPKNPTGTLLKLYF
jgi:hypothetical protein